MAKKLLFFLVFLFLVVTASTQQTLADSRPNIVIILADDMGYSYVGSFGGEIATPSIDALANDGVRFTNFYTHASCSPTRSMLLSGVDTHLSGLGNMSEWTGPDQLGEQMNPWHYTWPSLASAWLLSQIFTRCDMAQFASWCRIWITKIKKLTSIQELMGFQAHTDIQLEDWRR